MPANTNAFAAYNHVIRGRVFPALRLTDNGVDCLKGRPLDIQYEWDVAYWYGTLTSGMSEAWKNALLYRMWTIIWWGGLWWKNREGQWGLWSDTDMPIATCLSHGGRVLVELPNDVALGADIWRWLWDNNAPQPRMAATHGAIEGGCLSFPDGTLKHVRETGKGGAGHHFGVNIASGGFSNRDPVSGNTITDNGKFGHLYIYYLAPTGGTYGALLFGAEDSAPTDRSEPRFTFSRGQTGHLHTFGDSGPYSLTGGEKFKKLSQTSNVVPTGDDSMFVNPSWDVWRTRFLSNQAGFTPSRLGHSPPPPQRQPQPAAFVVIPQVKEFQKATYVSALHRRSDYLQRMDDQLKVFHSTMDLQRQKGALDNFITLGKLYIHHSESASLEAVVDGYVKGAESYLRNLP